MFQPSLFREERVDVMHALMKKHPFATLVSFATGSLSADHVPLMCIQNFQIMALSEGMLLWPIPCIRLVNTEKILR